MRADNVYFRRRRGFDGVDGCVLMGHRGTQCHWTQDSLITYTSWHIPKARDLHRIMQ